MQTKICLSHYARSWYVLFMAFVLQEIKCWIWVELRCQNVIVGWRVRGGHSHEPKQQFSSAVGIYFITVSCYRNLHQGFSGFALFNSTLKWTFNVQELLTRTLLAHTEECRNRLDMISLNRCFQVSSSSSLSHFQVWCSRIQTLSDLTSFQKF